MPTPDVLGRNGTYVVVPQAAHQGGGLPAVPARQGGEPRGGGAARREDGRALAERRAARARPRPATTPSSAPTPRATTTSSTATIRAGFKCPAGAHARRANPRDALDEDGSVDVRLHRMIRRGTSYGPMLPDGVLEDDGVDRGHHLRLRRRAPEAPVRVRQDPVAQRRHLHRRAGREGPAGRAERRAGTLHHPAAADPAPAARTCRRSSSPAAASTASPPACARCAGSRSWTRDTLDRREEDDVTTSPRPAPTAGTRWTSVRHRPTSRSPSCRCWSTTSPAAASPSITLNRPHADNAITTEMGARLTEVVETIAVRTAVRVVILTGAGDRAFSVGSDLRQRKNMTKEDWLRQRQDFDRTLYTVRQLRKPIFAAVNGIAYGGGSRDRPEHRLHHRLRQRHLRPARGDDRPGRRRRLAGLAAAPAARRARPCRC